MSMLWYNHKEKVLEFYPRLHFIDNESMKACCRRMPTRLCNEIVVEIFLHEERKPLLAKKKVLKAVIYKDVDSDISSSDVSW